MSVYKPGKGRFWHYDFVYQGRRYYGSTGVETESKAKRVEQAKRELAAKGELTKGPAPIPTLNQAATTWWRSKAHLKTADELLGRVSVAVELIGKDRPVNEVAFSDVQKAIQKRRGQLVRGKSVPANATVNRDIVSTIRPVLRLARKMLNDGKGPPIPFPEIDWGELRLAEPKPKAKDFTRKEIDALVEALPHHLRDFARFQARYGCRLAEMFFRLSAVDLEEGRVTLRDRKGGDDHSVPLAAEDVAMLAARIGRARAAKINSPWFRELKGGELKPIAYWGALHAIRDAMAATGLREAKGARGSHALRHHAGMQMLRSSGNLRVTQRLLGHANVQSTTVYAHAMEDDVRAALDKLSRPAPEPVVSGDDETCENPLLRKGK